MKKIVFVLALILGLQVNQCFAVGWLKGKPASSDSPSDIATLIQTNNTAVDLMLSKYREGCKLTYSTAAQLTVGTGGIMVSNSDGSVRLMVANTAATTVTWADIDTGSEAASTTYYVYAICSAITDTTFTCKISTSSTAPSGVTYYRRLGSFYNDGSSNITQITNDDANILISTGTINNGETIPLPTGYAQDQCKWMVGVGSIGFGGDQHATSYSFQATVDANRLVTVTASQNFNGGYANYMIIGYK